MIHTRADDLQSSAMITKKEYSHNFVVFGIASKLCLLPLEINVETGTFQLRTSGRKRKVSVCMVVVMILHSCYVIFRFFQTVLFGEKIVRHHLLFHIDYSLASVMVMSWYYLYFIRRPDISVAIFNGFFQNQPREFIITFINHYFRNFCNKRE